MKRTHSGIAKAQGRTRRKTIRKRRILLNLGRYATPRVRRELDQVKGTLEDLKRTLLTKQQPET